MLPYTSESFDDDERELLRHYVTNLDGPVFALVNLPEVVKGALFARYSRSPKSLRRLFLTAFASEQRFQLQEDAVLALGRRERSKATVAPPYRASTYRAFNDPVHGAANGTHAAELLWFGHEQPP